MRTSHRASCGFSSRSSQQNRRHAKTFASTKIPENLTETLRDKINSLGDSPKEAYLKEEIFSKFVSSDTDPASVRRQRAINKWLATERENEATNDRLITTPLDFLLVNGVTVGKFVSFCQREVERIIGDTPPIDALIGSFSGGASTSRPRTESHPAGKYLGKADVTERCLELFEGLISEMPGWLSERDRIQPNIVPGNVMFTVPKKTDIDRCACKEPDLNMFIQKGIGSYFRKCLLRTGINLNDQSINRSLARSGSYTGNLSTLDLSSASDSVSTELVFQLLPVTWFTLLDSARSPVTIIDGEEHRNHMFSSMGNGFTFELESLIFFVLTRAVCYFTRTRGVVSVYGDDIICPRTVSLQVIRVLEFFGFQVNLDKSHTSGPFRESCGGHYYNGYDITPFYLKGPILSVLDLVDAANKLRKWAEPDNGYPGDPFPDHPHTILEHGVFDIWSWLRDLVPQDIWGGDDTSFKYRLVSPHIGRKRVVEETTRLSNGEGGYYHWLNATWDRKDLREGVETSSRTRSSERYRLRSLRHPTVARLSMHFYEEVHDTEYEGA